MEIYMTFRHMEPTTGIRVYIEKKAALLTKYIRKAERMNVVFSLERYVHCVDITLYEKKHVFRAEGMTTDMYASIDQVMHNLEEQLKRYRERIKHHKNYFKSPEGRLNEAHDMFDRRLQRERQTKRAWKSKNRGRSKMKKAA